MGREKELTQLKAMLDSGENVAISAIAGIGGVGKTELATQYARRNWEEYKAIPWIVETIGDIRPNLFSYFLKLGISVPEPLVGRPVGEQIQACWRQYLADVAVKDDEKILVVFDDISNLEAVKDAIPPFYPFRVLITTRMRNLDPNLVATLPLDVLEPAAALALLKSLLGENDRRIANQTKIAEELCKWLEYLPLALELVGAYLANDPDLSLADCFEQLQRLGLDDDALQRSQITLNSAERGVKAAFALTWQKLAANSRETALLLSLFASWGIVWEVVEVTAIAEELNEIRTPLAKTKKELNEGKKELYRYHLLGFWQEKGVYNIHSLIHLFFKEQLAEQERFDLLPVVSNTLLAIAQTIPQTPTLEQITAISPFIPHLEALAEDLAESPAGESPRQTYLRQRQKSIQDEDIGWIFTSLGRFYQGQGDYTSAEPWFEQCVEVVKSRLGDRHPDVASSLNNLAILYYSQGRYELAEPLYEETLTLYKELLGERHPLVAQSLNNLAYLYQSQGRYELAEPLLVEALALFKELLGERHPSVAVSLNALAELYRLQGRYELAEPLHEESLALRKELLGDRHPSVAVSLNNLAALYNSQGRYKLAEPLHEEALALFKELLGERHPDVASSLNNLAGLYNSQGRYKLAEPLLVEALALNKELVGERHPHVAVSLNNLAALYQSQGKFQLAEPLLVEALALNKESLGDRHPHVAKTLENLALLYIGQGKLKLAEPLYKEILSIREERLGTDHPETISIRRSLAIVQFFKFFERGIGKLINIIVTILFLPLYLLLLGLQWLMFRLRR
ncbi:MAG: tetratricopeptide repeat protein [Microcystis sp. M113S1]|uniref:tetratricopeptide repeat protein n=1 Tax=Microcystis sp. M113S1 TaxID=2771104 RepID=UPI00258F29EF|nr:tetratricopeptide repeat protein [Microcystis sp. M113S1]MCA2938111.1 tetratricopeptide repeat protein [Microcystis sp. M113S1]